jgi:alpha-glucosidase
VACRACRSGFTRSPGEATLFWLGDQLQSWDEYDGIKTAMVGLLSGGVYGFSLIHSDTGGSVVLKLSLSGAVQGR